MVLERSKGSTTNKHCSLALEGKPWKALAGILQAALSLFFFLGYLRPASFETRQLHETCNKIGLDSSSCLVILSFALRNLMEGNDDHDSILHRLASIILLKRSEIPYSLLFRKNSIYTLFFSKIVFFCCLPYF